MPGACSNLNSAPTEIITTIELNNCLARFGKHSSVTYIQYVESNRNKHAMDTTCRYFGFGSFDKSKGWQGVYNTDACRSGTYTMFPGNTGSWQEGVLDYEYYRNGCGGARGARS